MYDWSEVEPDIDSSLCLIHGAVSRGHKVFLIYPHNLTISEGKPLGFCKTLVKDDHYHEHPETYYGKAVLGDEELYLDQLDVLFLRDNPPVDNILLNFLDPIKEDVFIVNDIDGMRMAANKIYPASYYDPENPFVPKTWVSKNVDYLMKKVRESESKKIIIKPLDGFGGVGVIVIDRSFDANLRSILEFYIKGKRGQTPESVIVQEYVPGAENGDIRVLILNGEPIGAMRRVPAEGDNRSNISAGGSAVPHKLSDEEKAICKAVGPKLVKDGLYFVGIDIIGSHLIEINISSPGGIPEINEMGGYGYTVEDKVIEYVESVIEGRKNATSGVLAH